MLRRPIRSMSSDEKTPPRVCDIVVDNGSAYLEIKTGKNRFIQIPWDDLKYQAESAIADSSTS